MDVSVRKAGASLSVRRWGRPSALGHAHGHAHPAQGGAAALLVHRSDTDEGAQELGFGILQPASCRCRRQRSGRAAPGAKRTSLLWQLLAPVTDN